MRERRPRQRIALLLVVERVEQVVHRQHQRMLPVQPIGGARVHDREVRIVDDRAPRDVEILILAALHVAGGQPAAQAAEIQVDAHPHGVGGDVQDVALAGGRQLLPP